VIFPEGTMTDGRQVKRFHARLFQPAIDSTAPILPIAIRYKSTDGARSRSAAYIDEDHILGSLVRVLSTRRLLAEVILLAPIETDEQPQRGALAKQAQQLILQAIHSHP